MKTIYLYLKTHNKTGLKYLGKTTQDPFTYRGSGKIWAQHIKKHGNDVTTKILFESTDKVEFKRVAIEFSNLYDIVKSSEFANLTTEEGQGGATWIDRKHSEKSRKQMSKTRLAKQLKGNKHIRSKQCIIDGIEYESVRIAAEILNVHHTTISYRCRSKFFHNYSYT
jgi:hypothetical protein